MRILSLSLDRSILDPASTAAKRQALAYAGHEAVILVVASGEQKEFDLAPGIRVRTFGGASKFGAFMQARSHLRMAERPDVVTAQEPIYTGYLAARLAKRFGCGLHLQDHSGIFARGSANLRERVLRAYAESLLLRADRVRTVSQRGKKGLMTIGVQEQKIDVIPIATDIAAFSQVDRSLALADEILTVTRLESEKGVDILLNAFVEVQKVRSQASLVVVGGGSLRQAYERMARHLRIGTAVLFVGKEDDVKPFLARAGVYVQPSRFEGWGLAVIEAAAAGMPIVMSDVGCAGEVIKDGESGLVVPPGNPKALAASLLKVLSDASLAKRLGSAAKLAVANLPDAQATAALIRASLEAAAKTG
ncbi:glycosyltransferase family 4 protein [Patescibacteria group bacterium]|jgi:glycosyltransferase involved in cell wall biosynthesis|nr:glycosyltransferase family 4 protein [Patescibacteria group bacterium]